MDALRGGAAQIFTCTRAEAIHPNLRYVHSGHLVHYITHTTLKLLRNTILSQNYTWGLGAPPETHDLLDPLGVPSIAYNCSAYGGEGSCSKKEGKLSSGTGTYLMEALGRMEVHKNCGNGRPPTYPPISAWYLLQFLKRREAWPSMQHLATKDSISSAPNSARWTDAKFKRDRGVDGPEDVIT